MNALDLLILFGLAAGAVHGFMTGLIKQVASVFGVVLAFVVSLQFMRPVGEAVAGSLSISEGVAPLVGFVLVFLVIQVAVFAVTRMVESLVGALKLSSVNRLLGGGLGALKAMLALSVLFLVLHYVDVPGERMAGESQFYGTVSRALPDAWDFVSERIPQVQKVSEAFGETVQSAVSGSDH